MRLPILSSLTLACCVLAAPAFAETAGLPTDRFVLSWTALPAGFFTPWAAPATKIVALEQSHDTASNDKTLAALLGDAFASAADEGVRHAIALNEMMAAWDQPKRSAFQRLRDAEAAYAGTDDTRRARFVATLTDVVDGAGRSVATDGSDSAALEEAYAGALSRAGDFRSAVEATQKAWSAYREAFAAFADLQGPGNAAHVATMLDQQRAAELGPR